jgi:hypothetical protein
MRAGKLTALSHISAKSACVAGVFPRGWSNSIEASSSPPAKPHWPGVTSTFRLGEWPETR